VNSFVRLCGKKDQLTTKDHQVQHKGIQGEKCFLTIELADD